MKEGQKMRAELTAIGEVLNINITENDTRRADLVYKDTEIFLI